MLSIFIQLDHGRLVRQFVDVISSFKGSFEIVSGRTVLNAKSILGIYSLDLSQPLLLRIEPDVQDDLGLLLKFSAI